MTYMGRLLPPLPIKKLFLYLKKVLTKTFKYDILYLSKEINGFFKYKEDKKYVKR